MQYKHVSTHWALMLAHTAFDHGNATVSRRILTALLLLSSLSMRPRFRLPAFS